MANLLEADGLWYTDLAAIHSSSGMPDAWLLLTVIQEMISLAIKRVSILSSRDEAVLHL